MLILDNFSVYYGHKNIITSLNLKIANGEIIGLVAPNGSGKTTLMRGMTSLAQATGQIELNGAVPTHRTEYRRQFFFAESTAIFLPYLTGRDYLRYVKKAWHSTTELAEIILQTRINEFVDWRIGKYSLGMKQQLLLAMALLSSAPILILDEPMNGLDPTNLHVFSHALQKYADRNKTVLISSHILDNVSELCNHVVFLKQGVIVQELEQPTTTELKTTYLRVYADEVVNHD
ncbi:ATP-binding cassette domain-containing protein [Lapidilactobacillus wuchangensis]|uniref:ATP-binding cassette domain-containing protein n=1 Tax=Lapidilactobacillus wuchangensis TaxID=2486001 RepID=UPI000F77317D|nr:ABC transporter ATP-binding protein [Lapidilactobacillus wuchangensis]